MDGFHATPEVKKSIPLEGEVLGISLHITAFTDDMNQSLYDQTAGQITYISCLMHRFQTNANTGKMQLSVQYKRFEIFPVR
jgi:hypothetical protein